MNRAVLSSELSIRSLVALADYDAGRAAFPLGRALKSLMETGHPPEDLRAFNDELGRALPGERSQPAGLIIPAGVLLGNRALSATSGAAGAVTIQTDVAAPAVSFLRPLSSVLQAGAVVVDSLRGNISLPVMSAGVAPLSWLSEGAAAPELTETYGQLPSTPKRAGGWLRISKQLLSQSPAVVESAVMPDVNSAIAQCLDLAAIAGSGTGGQPDGVLVTAGVGSFAFGGAATIAPFATAEATLRTAGIVGPLTVLGSPAAIAKWRVNPRSATFTSRALLEDDNKIAGMSVIPSGNLPGNRVLIGQFGELQILVWGVEVQSNPYTFSLESNVALVLNLLADVRVSRAAAFTASTDSGAQ